MILKEEVKTTQEITNEASQLKADKTHLEERLKEHKTELVEQTTQNEELRRELSQLKEQKSRAVEALEKAKVEKAEIQRKASVLSGRLAQVTTSNLLDKRGHSRTKSVGEYSCSHLRRLKRKRRESCELSLTWLDREGYIATKVELLNTETGEKQSLCLNKEQCNLLFGPDADVADENDFDIINMMLLVKDQYQVSGSAYHEFTKICKEMPRHYKLKRRISELNSLWNIKPTPDGSGVQQPLEDRLIERIAYLLQHTSDDAPFKSTGTVCVKLSGDGTNIGKRLHVVNFGFTLLDEGCKAWSCEGNHCLAIFKQPEKYEAMKNALGDVIDEVERLKSVTVNGQNYNVKSYLGGDWKFLAMATGKPRITIN